MCNYNVMYYIIKYGLDERLILKHNILNLGETKNGQGYVGAVQMLFRFKIPAVHIVRTLNTAAPPNLPLVRKWRPLTECIYYKYLFEQKCIRIFSHIHAGKRIAHRVRSRASKQSCHEEVSRSRRGMSFHFHISTESFLFVKIIFISYNSTFIAIRKTISLPLSA